MIGRFNVADELLRENLDRRGHRTAVFYDESSLTFLELARSVNRFGNLLLGLGVRPRERVVIQLADSPACLGAFLGCIRAGLWPVLISPDLGSDTRDFILRDVQAAAWVTRKLR